MFGLYYIFTMYLKETALHNHNHPPVNLPNLKKSYWIAILLNIFFVVVEACVGLFSHSVSLLSDALHNLSDVASLVLGLWAILLPKTRATKNYTYGFRKTTILIGLLNSLLLLIVMGVIAWESITRLRSTEPIQGQWISLTAFAGIIINGFSAFLFIKDKHKDINIKSVYLHMAADALVSLGVLIAGLIIYFTHWFWVDPLISLIVIAVVVYSVWGLLTDSIRLALDGVPKGINTKAIEEFFLGLKNVLQIHDLHIWPISTTETALTVHLVVPGDIGENFYAHIQHELKAHFQISHSTIQVEKTQCLTDCFSEEPEHN